MLGVGSPVAVQDKSTSLPNLASMLSELEIRGATVIYEKKNC